MAHHLETADELAVMGPVFRRKDLVKKDRCNTECVELEFPGLVLCVELVGDIARLVVIRTREMTPNVLDILAVSGPNIAVTERSPIPHCFVVHRVEIDSAPPERQEKIREITSEMHDISGHGQGDAE